MAKEVIIKMSMFRCAICDIDFDSDFHEICKLDDLDCCEDCYADQETEDGSEQEKN